MVLPSGGQAEDQLFGVPQPQLHSSRSLIYGLSLLGPMQRTAFDSVVLACNSNGTAVHYIAGA